MDERDHFSSALPVDAEVPYVRRNDRIARMQFAEADETEIRQVGLPIGVSAGELSESGEMSGYVERGTDETVAHECKDRRSTAQVIGGLSENRVTGQQRLADLAGDLDGPRMMLVLTVSE